MHCARGHNTGSGNRLSHPAAAAALQFTIWHSAQRGWQGSWRLPAALASVHRLREGAAWRSCRERCAERMCARQLCSVSGLVLLRLPLHVTRRRLTMHAAVAP